jgi:hypothetical protein
LPYGVDRCIEIWAFAPFKGIDADLEFLPQFFQAALGDGFSIDQSPHPINQDFFDRGILPGGNLLVSEGF